MDKTMMYFEERLNCLASIKGDAQKRNDRLLERDIDNRISELKLCAITIGYDVRINPSESETAYTVTRPSTF